MYPRKQEDTLPIRYRYTQYVPHKLDVRCVRSVCVGRTLNTSMYVWISYINASLALLARSSYVMRTLHTRYTSLPQAETYDNVCKRVSNLHVAHNNACIAYLLRTPNL